MLNTGTRDAEKLIIKYSASQLDGTPDLLPKWTLHKLKYYYNND